MSTDLVSANGPSSEGSGVKPGNLREGQSCPKRRLTTRNLDSFIELPPASNRKELTMIKWKFSQACKVGTIFADQ